MYQVLLFDLDDTLYDLRSYWRDRLRSALAAVLPLYPDLDHALLVERALAERVYMAQWPDFLRRQGVADEALIATTHIAFQAQWFEQMDLADDARPTLEYLRTRYRLRLITNGPSATQRAKIARFGLERYMEVLVVSEEVGCAKPDPAIFTHALALMRSGPAEALYVGDSPDYDLCGAAAAGLAAIWMNPHHRQLTTEQCAPLAEIERLADLPHLLEELKR